MTNHVRSVFLIRHGRTSYNAAHKLQGQVDIPLDAVGEWQVKQTAAALKSLYVDRRPEINHRFIVCSDLKRAHATAQAFADVLGGIEPVDDRRVRERSYGVGMAMPWPNWPNATPRTSVPGWSLGAAS